jgi:phenylpropionate dioxygenase-like ring-hydroxylating dioxygenase large terminal subunit
MGTVANGRSWAQQYPELGTGPVSVEPNISAAYFELEREKVFKHTWLNVGRVEEIPNVGDYLVKDIAVLRTSVLVVRGKDKKIRAFHNACKHRGNKVCLNGGGSAKGFTCHFHGWSYDLEGKLGYVPDEDQFYGLDKGARDLTPIATEVWEGFIFINMEPHPQETLKDNLGELYDQFTGYFDEKPLAIKYEVVINANWKLAIDAFSEAYHVCALHRRSAYAPFASKENPFCHLSSVRLYQRHRSLTIPANPDFKPTPSAAVAFKHGGAATYITTPEAMASGLPPGVNPERIPNWAFDIYLLFPNFLIATGNGGYVITENLWPVAVDKFFWEVQVYLPRPKSWGEKISQEYTKAMLVDVSLEDLSTLENTQSVLASGAITHMLLSDQEIGPRHNYKVVADYVGR